MARKVQMLVSMFPPPKATVADVREYVLNAVKAERGLLHPEDPMHELAVETVHVRRFFQRKDA